MLVLNGLNAAYGSFKALNNISLNVNSGESVAVIGPNGAGKTTLLRVISGMLPVLSGEISMDGKSILSILPHEIINLGIAHVPENRRLFKNMSVLENLELGAFSPNLRQFINEQLELVYSLFPIMAERRNQLAGTLSGGEQQMCAIGRALMSKPKLLLMDEPSAGLAPLVVEKIFDLVQDLSKRGYTVLIVEQQINQVLEIVDRAYLIEASAILEEGDATTLRKSKNVQKAYMGL